MIQRVFKRFLSLLLVAVMLLGMIPAVSLTAYAADTSGELTSFDALIGLSYSSTSGTSAWTVDVNAKTVTGTVKTTSSCGTTQQDCTLTITSKLDIPAQFSFDYTVAGTGTATVDGTTVTTGGSFVKEVEAGGSVQVYIKSGTAGNDQLTLIVSNLLLAANVDVTTTFTPGIHGSFTVNGETISSEKAITQSAMNPYTMTATPDDGYMFMGWYDMTNGKYLNLNAVANLYLTADCTVTAKFVPVGTALFEAGGQIFNDLNKAGTYAKENGIAKIVLRTNGTITGNYTIPEGVTLLIPFDAAGTCYTTTPANTANKRTAPSVYRTLTMAPGSSITVNGAISVSAKHYAYGQVGAGAPDGNYGYIYMEEGSAIAINNGGALYVWGFLSGKGTVTAHSGATVYENMQIGDFRGGSATSGMNNNQWKVFPLNQYFIQNIETKLILESGADEYIYTSIFAGGSATSTSIHFIGDESAMFSVASGGYFEKEYLPDQDRVEISVHGDAQINSLTLKVYITVSSGNYVLPINNCMTLNIASGTTKITQDVALLAGVQVNVAQGAAVEVTQGSSLYVYDRDEWIAKNYAYDGKFDTTLYSPTRTYKRTEADLVDAKVDVNGTAIINGYGYTTAGGAAIISSDGTGKVVFNSGAGTETETYMFVGTGTTGDPIAITPAKLMNADGTYTETAEAVNGDYWTYEDGVWVPTLKDRVIVTLDANNDTDAPQKLTIAKDTPTVLPENPFTYEGFTFTGWNTEPDGTGEAYADQTSVNFSEDTTLYAQWEVAKFTVTWKNGYSTIYTETVEYGTMPEYTGAEPTKAATAQYTYTFKGWSPELEPVKADVTYTAQFDQTVNKYLITWYDEDGTTELASSEVDYNAMPEYPYGTPEKAGNSEITYVFNGWTPTLVKVTKDASYTATFHAVNNHTVTWVNWDGTELDEARVTAEQTPEYTGSTPVREGDAQYVYTFTGWEPVQSANDSDMIYKAVFEKALRSYTVTWLDEDGAVLNTQSVTYGAFPVAPNMDAEKIVTETIEVPVEQEEFSEDAETVEDTEGETEEALETYTTEEVSTTYYFAGWTPVLTRVTGDVTYQAVYTEQPVETHTVTWQNWDGTELKTVSDVDAGTIVSYDGEAPIKEADEQYSYTFSGWDTTVEGESGNIVYTATFTAEGVPYTVTWQNEDGTTLKTEEVPYGELPVYSGAVPTRASDGDVKYVFSGWTPAVSSVTGEATYTAAFEQAVSKFTITWENWDGTVLGTSTVNEGVTPEYTGEAPTRPADEQYTYTFSGWTPEVVPAMADETYKAVFSPEAVEYTISWYAEDGVTLLAENQVPYGTLPVYPGETLPEKAEDADYIYTFAGWEPEITAVQGNTSYTAVFTPVEKLTVTWMNGEEVLKTEKVASGTTPAYTDEDPVKEDDEEYSYTFIGWDPEPAAITEDTVYTAKFEQRLHQYTITWLNYDGTELATSQVSRGDMPQYPGSTPTRPYDENYSYDFNGWKPAVVSAQADATYTASFAPTAFVKHTVTFNANGGEGTMEPQVFRVGVSETLRANAFTREYHEFLGWNTEADGSGAVYAEEGDIIELTEDITLYAQWKELEKPIAPITTYADFLSCLKQLEIYANQYALEHSDEDAVALVINYIRSGVDKYNSGTWNTFCGPENTAFVNFVAGQEASREGAQRLRELESFTLPNGDAVEFDHMFGCMDMAYHSGIQKTADLGSWAGDICDLVQLTTNAGVTGTVEEMAEEIRINNDKYFLYDHPTEHSFGRRDLYADLDAFYILTKLPEGRSISAIMESYFNTNLTDSIRAKFFLDNRFSGITAKSEIREAVLETYLGNDGILSLEKSYVPDGVNEDLRKACCYAFADYLYETAGNSLVNPYYTVFSSEVSSLAPGITQQTKMALTQDEKQIVYYLAYADVSRSDVSVHANYHNNDGSSWGMSRVTDQMKAAEANHSDPESDRYVPNYSAVVGINGDFYNMSTGTPSGALVMEGVEYHGLGGENFFGILKDGTPIIGGSAEWNANEGNIQEAIGASNYLVKDGKIAVTASDNYYSSRVSRTCVGITYDGRVVFMALDGRQEPFSAGGAAIEIAQIMLDAGCVTAVNLDGGGSTTFATKAEGEETITIKNRPSDGYERSVSSSLMIVSTAKPSNVFDHAVISADYDYLTVGTSLSVTVSGVTATGGAIAVPENSVLKVSDKTVGTLTDGVFTATALGEVQVQLVDADGAVLGSKTLNVVEPTDIRFTKSSINAIYGEAVTLPLEATYNGNPVKINPDDVVFGYVKITLASIDMGEETVNTTVNELVYDYPEAGTITGFDFTANEAGGLRTLTIGAILKNKTAEFEASYAAEYQRVYQEALSNQFAEDEARIQAQNAAISKALGEAAQTMAYMYKSDEAEFDFNTAYGDSLFSWHRTVPNSEYKDDTATYYLKGQQDETSINYTFAVDMSKVAIPEKLTSLLYMLPGGDQEGRTAWDFMLQLAERISPLTTVTISLNVPEGFTVDTSDLRLANELFTLSSCEVENGVLKVVCNFIEQSEPINPTTVNPLCVLSGLKLIADEGAWPLDGSPMECFAVGELSYDIYAHFHILESLAQDPAFQEEYGLYPYNNTENIPGDSGAHFMETIIQFEDQCFLAKDSTVGRNGWYRDNGKLSYYVDGTPLTGVQELPSHIEGEEGKFWYNFGENGWCRGKLSGLFETGGNTYYAINGILQSGWWFIADAEGNDVYYYFDSNTYQGLNGKTTRFFANIVYEFENGKLLHGVWGTSAKGTRYYYGPSYVQEKWYTIDGNRYYFDSEGYRYEGYHYVNERNNHDDPVYWYDFGEDGICKGVYQYTGLLTIDDKTYYVDNSMVYIGLILTEDGYYYYFSPNDYAAVTGACYVAYPNGLLPMATYVFDSDSKMVSEFGLITNDNGDIQFLVDGEPVYAGVVRDEEGNFYYINSSLCAVKNRTYTIYAHKTNGMIEAGEYTFGADGKMIIDAVETKKGLVIDEDGEIRYYENGVATYAGLVQDEEGNFYYINSSLKAVKDCAYHIYSHKTNGLLPAGEYTFDADGKMVMTPEDPEVKNGLFTDEDGEIRYYENGTAIYAGLVQDEEGNYYYINSSLKAVKGCTYHIYSHKTNGLLPAGEYKFGADGKMIVEVEDPSIKNGLITDEDGEIRYYENGIAIYAGLVQDEEGNYYYINSSLKAVKNCTYHIYAHKSNSLLPAGDYAFDANGKMIIA